MDDDKEKTLALLANRICEKCAKKIDDSSIVKHGCCIHFITAVYNEFYPPTQMKSGTSKPFPTVTVPTFRTHLKN